MPPDAAAAADLFIMMTSWKQFYFLFFFRRRGQRYFAICSPSAWIEMLTYSGLWDEDEGTSKQPISASLDGCEILKMRSGSGSLNLPGSQQLLFQHRDFTESTAEIGSVWILKGQERKPRQGDKSV